MEKAQDTCRMEVEPCDSFGSPASNQTKPDHDYDDDVDDVDDVDDYDDDYDDDVVNDDDDHSFGSPASNRPKPETN